MLDVKSYIYRLFTTDSTLLALVENNIMQGYPEAITVVPILLFVEENQSCPPDSHYDNASIAEESTIKIDVYVQRGQSTTAIVQRVSTLMEAELWHCELSSDVPEPDVRYSHRTMRYRRKISSEELI